MSKTRRVIAENWRRNPTEVLGDCCIAEELMTRRAASA
jgi:hypothetical protein